MSWALFLEYEHLVFYASCRMEPGFWGLFTSPELGSALEQMVVSRDDVCWHCCGTVCQALWSVF